MKKYLFAVLLLLLLTACGSSGTSQNDPEAEPTVGETAVVEATAVEEEPAPATEPTAEEPTEESELETDTDTAVTAADGPAYNPAATIDEAAQLKATDHSKGAEAPIIAIIEYGDFQ